MDTLTYILDKHKLDINIQPPILFSRQRYKYLPGLFRDLGFTTGAEVGVGVGHFSKRLCKKNKKLKLYSIDAWQCYGYYLSKVQRQERMEAKYQAAIRRLSPFNSTIIREFSRVAVKRFDDNSLDFVYIDSNHDFNHAYQDIGLWEKKVRPGGIVAGHDYVNLNDADRCRVKDAVLKWTGENNISPWFVIVGSQYPSYFWVKQ